MLKGTIDETVAVATPYTGVKAGRTLLIPGSGAGPYVSDRPTAPTEIVNCTVLLVNFAASLMALAVVPSCVNMDPDRVGVHSAYANPAVS